MKSYYDKLGGDSPDAMRRKYASVAVRVPEPMSGFVGRLILIKYTDPDALLGPRNNGGIQWEGDCEVYDHLVTGAAEPSPRPTGTASGAYCQGLVVPGEYVWARFSNGKYWVQSALHMVRATAISSDEATVTTEYGTVEVEFTGLCSSSDEEIVSGQVVGLSWAWRVTEPDLIATKLCCPPEPA